MWCWRRLLRVLWTARRSNQSILKEISPEYSLEGLMVKLKFQSFGHLMWRTDSSGKTLMLGRLKAGGEGNNREWDGWMASLTQWTWVWVNSGSWWWTGRPGMLWFMESHRVRHDWVSELNWMSIPIQMTWCILLLTLNIYICSLNILLVKNLSHLIPSYLFHLEQSILKGMIELYLNENV